MASPGGRDGDGECILGKAKAVVKGAVRSRVWNGERLSGKMEGLGFERRR